MLVYLTRKLASIIVSSIFLPVGLHVGLHDQADPEITPNVFMTLRLAFWAMMFHWFRYDVTL